MASQSSKRPSEEPHYTRGPAKWLRRAASELLLVLPAPSNAPSMTPPSTPPTSSSNSPATDTSSPTISMNRLASPVRPATPETSSKAAGHWLPTEEEIFELHAYMRSMGWDIHIDSGDSIPFDGSPDLDYEYGLGEFSDEYR